jgi:hypothetical protein
MMKSGQTIEEFMLSIGYEKVTEIPTYEIDGDAIRKGFDDLKREDDKLTYKHAPNKQMADSLMKIFGYTRVEEVKHKDDQIRNLQKDSPR